MRESKDRLELLRTTGTYVCFSVSSPEDVGDLQRQLLPLSVTWTMTWRGWSLTQTRWAGRC